MTIYKHPDSKSIMLALYDNQLNSLNRPFNNIYLETHFGKTHVVEIGNMTGKSAEVCLSAKNDDNDLCAADVVEVPSGIKKPAAMLTDADPRKFII